MEGSSTMDIVFEFKESQSREHFHVPLLLSPFHLLLTEILSVWFVLDRQLPEWACTTQHKSQSLDFDSSSLRRITLGSFFDKFNVRLGLGSEDLCNLEAASSPAPVWMGTQQYFEGCSDHRISREKMQAVKDKLHDMTAMRKAKAEAKAEEKTEKELAKARMDVAHEVRLAREAEAEMELHVAKAGQRVEREIAKHELNGNNIIAPQNNNNNNKNIIMDDKVCSYGSRNDDASTCGAGYASQKDNYCGGGRGGVHINSNAAATNLTGAPADAAAAAHYTTAGRAASFPHNERL
ncbi:LATE EMBRYOGENESIS ABUNDANT PROTEIN 6-RELATED [Salix viminalis]|uniref:LATE EMBRYOGENESIS ABUNDANT PROTEIN 6-RELATED n=2 Tax=Salix viminalis TaxID=40686 RepID=A0A9Q0NR63_SALVM|nr:LATE EMBRYOGENESIS ABUNDANT PROTEIN 6-RELATED [Salix viminalis]